MRFFTPEERIARQNLRVRMSNLVGLAYILRNPGSLNNKRSDVYEKLWTELHRVVKLCVKLKHPLHEQLETILLESVHDS